MEVCSVPFHGYKPLIFLPRATYIDGALVDAKTGQKSEPRPCAGNDGTTISVSALVQKIPKEN